MRRVWQILIVIVIAICFGRVRVNESGLSLWAAPNRESVTGFAPRGVFVSAGPVWLEDVWVNADYLYGRLHARLGGMLSQARIWWHYARDTPSPQRSITIRYPQGAPRINSTTSNKARGVNMVASAYSTADRRSTTSNPTSADSHNAELSLRTSIGLHAALLQPAFGGHLQEPHLDASWAEVLQFKAERLKQKLDKEMRSLILSEISSLASRLRADRASLLNLQEAQLKALRSYVDDIDCIAKLNEATGELEYYDKTGSRRLEQYITSQLLALRLTSVQNILHARIQEIATTLELVPSSLTDKLKQLLQDQIELLEEWAEAIVTEWSRRLAHMDAALYHYEAPGHEETSHKQWQAYWEARQQLRELRDNVLDLPAAHFDIERLPDFLEMRQMITSWHQEADKELEVLRETARELFASRDAL